MKTKAPPFAPRLVGTMTLLVATAACQDATGPAPVDDTLLPELAAVAADAVVEDVTLMGQPFGFGPALMPGGPGGGHGGPPGQPGGHHGIGRDLSGTRSVTFFDAAGETQEAYDPLTTASLHAVLEMAGEVERPGWSASVERTRDMTVTGLEGDEATRTFDGSGTEAMSRLRTTVEGEARSWDMVGSFTKTAVVVPVPGSESPWPLSGTVHRTMTVTATGTPGGDFTRTVTATITFDGDHTATAVIDGESFEIDLSARPGRDPIHSGFGRGPGG